MSDPFKDLPKNAAVQNGAAPLRKSIHDRHRPLTLCPEAGLDWSRPGTPASNQFGDIYFSVEGGLDETRAVYLSACGLPQRWQNGNGQDTAPHFTIAELGFGTGLNFLATWQLWQQSGQEKSRHKYQRLHYVSIEKYPLSKEQLRQALTHWPELADFSAQLVEKWPGRVRGYHRLHFANVSLTLIHDDVSAALDSAALQADAWYLDGFSPARNPEMWAPAILSRIGELSADGAMIGTFTAAGAVRQGLSGAGFDVEKVAGFGRKRHRIQAVMRKTSSQKPMPANPIIIGAGISGASLARSFMMRGIIPTVIDPDDGSAASGNAAAIVKPRLDRQDKDDSRFFLSSYLYALRAYAGSDGIRSTGVFDVAKTDEHTMRFTDLVELASLPSDHMVWREDGPYGTSGLYFPKALIVDPPKICETFLKGAVRVKARVKVGGIAKQDGVWHVCDFEGNPLAVGSHVILALGDGARDLPMLADQDLRFNRGQLTWVSGDDGGGEMAFGAGGSLTYGGYAIDCGDGVLLGATHDPIEPDQMQEDVYESCEQDDRKNIEGFAAISDAALTQIDKPSRVSVRVNTAQTWPVIFKNKLGMRAVTGLGSRGFVSAPLLAEAIVSDIFGEPTAIPSGLFYRAL